MKNLIVPSENTYAIYVIDGLFDRSECVAAFINDCNSAHCEGHIVTSRTSWVHTGTKPDIYARRGSFDVVVYELNERAGATGCYHSIDIFIRDLCGDQIGGTFSRIDEYFKRCWHYRGEEAESSDEGFNFYSATWLVDNLLFDKLEKITGITYDRSLWKNARNHFLERDELEATNSLKRAEEKK